MLCACISPRQQHGSDVVKMFEVSDKPAQVRKGLFIGSWDSESDKELLDKLGITHILQVRRRCVTGAATRGGRPRVGQCASRDRCRPLRARARPCWAGMDRKATL